MNSLTASMLSRPLIGSARLGLLRQLPGQSSALHVLRPSLFRPQPTRPLPPSACRSVHMSTRPKFRHNGHDRSSSSSSSQSSFSPWYLAAAIPMVVVPGDAPTYETPPPSRSLSSYSRYDLPLNPEFAAEVSKGSVIGFAIGLLVSTFSKSLVLLLGLAITLQSVAARAGIDLVHYFKLKERFSSSRVLTALSEHTAFKLAFGVCFMLSSVMHF
ncbi:fun14 family protein [Ophiostoma piceae UAMH 11346]|uniref:Fun14 family protein n=1 Tax=Ophiostoma piceae (strain UAMH 11346) TaxID=1262450 RepID=S3CKP1_OPHP1|nr:fun14 family protein [Ophiostoma piceae UAMH 11346]